MAWAFFLPPHVASKSAGVADYDQFLRVAGAVKDWGRDIDDVIAEALQAAELSHDVCFRRNEHRRENVEVFWPAEADNMPHEKVPLGGVGWIGMSSGQVVGLRPTLVLSRSTCAIASSRRV